MAERAAHLAREARILVVEDDADLLDVLVELFRHAGFAAEGAPDGLSGLQAFERSAFDLVVLDVMMPKIDGFTLCEAIRAHSDVPIMVLTALSGDDDQLKAFSLLADDYVTKPFSLAVVLERARALLRRCVAGGGAHTTLRAGGVTLNQETHEVLHAGEAACLTKTEFDILALMMAHPGRVFTRAALAAAGRDAGFEAWPGGESAVKLHVMNIRRKLGEGVVETVRGVGYRVPKDR